MKTTLLSLSLRVKILYSNMLTCPLFVRCKFSKFKNPNNSSKKLKKAHKFKNYKWKTDEKIYQIRRSWVKWFSLGNRMCFWSLLRRVYALMINWQRPIDCFLISFHADLITSLLLPKKKRNKKTYLISEISKLLL